MKLAPFVALALASAVLGLAGAELAEVLRSTRHGVLEELKGNPTERLAY